MNSAPSAGHSEGQLTIKPPLFNRFHFIWWKTCMENFIQVEYELWDRITIGPTIHMKTVKEKKVKKVRSDFTPEDIGLKKNTKAKNILVCGLGPDEYNRILNCITIKKIWDALINAHEGTSLVKKFRVAMLFIDYKAFKMKESESLQKMITRLTSLINELSSLG